MDWTVARLREFEESIRQAYLGGTVKAALHLSRGNEAQLIEIFKDVRAADYVYSTYRSHYHALLHGIHEEQVRAEIMAGHSISLNFPQYRFFTSSIVGGNLPIAVGTALAIKRRGGTERVWCFTGDMAASCGMFHDCAMYVDNFELPLTFVVENNGYSTNTPTAAALGADPGWDIVDWDCQRMYRYEREWPHSGFKV